MSSVSETVGILAGSETVKQATIDLLSSPPPDAAQPLIVYYLAEVERQAGLRPGTLRTPPAPESFYGGVDFESWTQDLLPSIVVIAEPVEEPVRFGTGVVGHWFEMQIAAVVEGADEDVAQMIASHYGTAVMGAVMQSGYLNGTELTAAPKVELVETDTARVFAMSVLTVRVFLEQIVDAFAGPAGPVDWPSDPYTAPGDYPTVETVNVEVEAVSAAADVGDATFTGDDTIHVTE